MNNNTLAHDWFYQRHDTAKGSNMYYTGDTIYSYGSHFPIARMFTSQIVFLTYRGYSNTTAKHISHVRSAIPNTTTVIYCERPSEDDETCIESAWLYASNRLVEFNALKRKDTKKAHALWAQLNYLIEGLRRLPWSISSNKLAKKITRLIETFLAIPAPTVAEKKIGSPDADKIIANWKARKRLAIPYAVSPYAHLRLSIDGLRVETSRGITVSLADALDFYEGLKGGGVFLDTYAFGLYKVNELGVYSVTLGCHKMLRSEFEEIIAGVNHG